MKKRTRRGLTLVLAALFLGAGCWLGVQRYQSHAAQTANDRARALAGLTDQALDSLPEEQAPLSALPEEQASAPAEVEDVPQAAAARLPALDATAKILSQLDLDALRQENPDVVGWIEIPGTVISYPLLQGEDNSYYLEHAWTGAASAAGAIYLDWRNDVTLSDFNTIIYGHRMTDGTMFYALHDYKDPDHYEQHPAVYLVTDEGVRRYEIFAAYQADAITKHTYRLGLTEQSGQQAYIDYCTGRSVLDTGIVPQPGDHILTLSTCAGVGTYDVRWVVQAVYRDTEGGS